MASPAETQQLLRFGTFELDIATCELRRQGSRVALALQPARTLRLLALHAGELVTRDELRRELWGEQTFVDYDSGLATCINQVRAALGDRAASPRFVETLPRRGYRFIAEVRRDGPAGASDEGRPRTDADSTTGRRARPALAAAVRAAAGVLGLAGLLAIRGPNPAAPAPRVPSIVVLPIATSGESGLGPIADTLMEGVIGELATVAGPRARVASRAHRESLRGREVDQAAIRSLGADYFVAITLRHVGRPVRVHAKLADANGWILWSTDYDLEQTSLTAVVSDVATTLARKAAREIVPSGEGRARREPAGAAVASYARANDDLAGGRLVSSITNYEEALRADPRHLGSYHGLAEAHLNLAFAKPERAEEHFAAAQAAVDRALAVDADDAGALTAQGTLTFARDFEPARAERLLRRATQLDPWLPEAKLWHAEVLAALGDFDHAVTQARAASALEPLGLQTNRALGHVLLIAGDYASLREHSERFLALAPGNPAAQLWKAVASGHLGNEAEAAMSRRDFVAALGLSPRAGPLSWGEVYSIVDAAPAGRWPWLRAVTAALGGRTAEALRWLQVCHEIRMADLQWADHNPLFESVRREPQFASLVAFPVSAPSR
jgi:DNA-binding winged helix-turn-helix (wHTH) protein/TolB-like protein